MALEPFDLDEGNVLVSVGADEPGRPRLRLPVQRHRYGLGPAMTWWLVSTMPLRSMIMPVPRLARSQHRRRRPGSCLCRSRRQPVVLTRDGLDVARPDVHGRRRKVFPDNGLWGAAREHRDEATAGEGADDARRGRQRATRERCAEDVSLFRSRNLLEAHLSGHRGCDHCVPDHRLVVLRCAIWGRKRRGTSRTRAARRGLGRLSQALPTGFGGWRGRGERPPVGRPGRRRRPPRLLAPAHNVPGVNLGYGSRHSCEQAVRPKTLGVAANVSFA